MKFLTVLMYDSSFLICHLWNLEYRPPPYYRSLLSSPSSVLKVHLLEEELINKSLVFSDKEGLFVFVLNVFQWLDTYSGAQSCQMQYRWNYPYTSNNHNVHVHRQVQFYLVNLIIYLLFFYCF